MAFLNWLVCGGGGGGGGGGVGGGVDRLAGCKLLRGSLVMIYIYIKNFKRLKLPSVAEPFPKAGFSHNEAHLRAGLLHNFEH